MDFFELIKARRSIRAYQNRPVEQASLNKILEAANRAPSAGNVQAYVILIVRELAIKEALAQASLNQGFLAQAPVVLAFFADPQRAAGNYKKRGAELYSVQDATIACAYAQLAAAELGLGNVWVGAFDDAAVCKILKPQSDWRPVALLPIGYPAESPRPTPRRALDDLTREVSGITFLQP
jgi:nitroreductase